MARLILKPDGALMMILLRNLKNFVRSSTSCSRLTFLFLVIFLALILVACSEKPTIRIIVNSDKSNLYQLRVNGKPLNEFERRGGGVGGSSYEGSYNIYEVQRANIEIVGPTKVDFPEGIEVGTYIINLDPKYVISYKEIRYCYNPPCSKVIGIGIEGPSGEVRGIGIKRLSTDLNAFAFKFNEMPPESIQVKRSDGFARYQYFQLNLYEKQWE